MKKILLSCVTCLLAIGLVTACDNDDEVENDGTVNPPSETTEDGTDTTVASLSNYTLSFTFTYGGETEAVPDYATAYISYGKVGQSWGDLMALTVTESGAYAITLDSVEATTYEYKIVLCYVDATPDWSHELTTTNQSFTVEASQGDGYTLDITITCSKSLTDVITDPTIAPRTNYVLAFQFLDEDGEARTLGADITLYIGGGWDGWSEYVECTYDETNSVYYYKFDEISVGTYDYLGTTDTTFVAEGCKVITSGNDKNASITISEDEDVDGAVQLIYVDSNGVVISEDSEEEIVDVGTRFYIVFLGQDTTSTSGFSNYYIHCGQSNVFLHNGDSDYHNYVGVTTGTVTSNECDYIYTSSYGTLEPSQTDWFYIYEEEESDVVGSNYYDTNDGDGGDATVLLDISTGTITIPETADDTYAVYVCTVNFGNASSHQDAWYGEWTTGVTDIEAFVAALTPQTDTSGNNA